MTYKLFSAKLFLSHGFEALPETSTIGVIHINKEKNPTCRLTTLNVIDLSTNKILQSFDELSEFQVINHLGKCFNIDPNTAKSQHPDLPFIRGRLKYQWTIYEEVEMIKLNEHEISQIPLSSCYTKNSIK